MDITLILQIIIFAMMGSLIYIVVGIIPGTDETSVLVPAAILLFTLNVNPLGILSFFIAAMISLNLTDSIPTALTSIPGGVMSTPLIEQSKYLKDEGLVTISIRKMTTGSLYGTISAFVASIIVIVFVNLLTDVANFPIRDYVNTYSSYIFLGGAVLLSLLSKKKIISLLSIIPFGIIILLAQKVHPEIKSTPFFLSITTGPLLFQLVSLLVPKVRKKLEVDHKKELSIIKDEPLKKGEFFKLLGGPEAKPTLIASFIASFLFFLSPVGVTMLIGEASTGKSQNKKQQALTQVSAMNGIANATYLSGIMISLFAFGIPISPAAAGPGGPLFDPANGFIASLDVTKSIMVIFLAAVIALSITIFLTLKYASKMTEAVFKYIPQEAVVSLLIGLVILLVYLEAGFLGILVIFLVALTAGLFNSFGVSYGVLFMAFYARSIWQILFN